MPHKADNDAADVANNTRNNNKNNSRYSVGRADPPPAPLPSGNGWNLYAPHSLKGSPDFTRRSKWEPSSPSDFAAKPKFSPKEQWPGARSSRQWQQGLEQEQQQQQQVSGDNRATKFKCDFDAIAAFQYRTEGWRLGPGFWNLDWGVLGGGGGRIGESSINASKECGLRHSVVGMAILCQFIYDLELFWKR